MNSPEEYLNKLLDEQIKPLWDIMDEMDLITMKCFKSRLELLVEGAKERLEALQEIERNKPFIQTMKVNNDIN